MKQFIHTPLQQFELNSKETAGHRFYQDPGPVGIWYPSVTTILKDYKKESLEEWKKAIGTKKANKIKEDAAIRGDEVHSLIEHFILNRDVPKPSCPNVNKLYKQLFMQCKKFVNNIRLSESALFSPSLGIAGRVDLVADYNSKLSVIDFKTATNIKRDEHLDSYKIQTALYAHMIKELYDVDIEQVVIMIACEKLPTCQTVIVDPTEFLSVAKQQIVKYYLKYEDFILKVNQ